MKNLTIARRYAKALLIIGNTGNQVDAYRDELNGFAVLISSEPELGQVINNPLYNTSDRKKILINLIEKLKISRVMSSFLLLLFDKGRFGFLNTINEFYQKLADDLKGVARASLVSANELSSEAVERIRKALSKKTGKDIVFDIRTDPTLIGGVITKIGDLVLDGSIKTQLLNMRESLKRGESV